MHVAGVVTVTRRAINGEERMIGGLGERGSRKSLSSGHRRLARRARAAVTNERFESLSGKTQYMGTRDKRKW